ncbi:hypothetical protein [Pseudomonas sp.]|uniref:hypothetical protein n=1 Tax=Pseudomonas sp. TaxID=306 RepID=UPI003FD83266
MIQMTRGRLTALANAYYGLPLECCCATAAEKDAQRATLRILRRHGLLYGRGITQLGLDQLNVYKAHKDYQRKRAA